jgi:hypothetical protein
MSTVQGTESSHRVFSILLDQYQSDLANTREHWSIDEA